MKVHRVKLDWKALLMICAMKSRFDTKSEPRDIGGAICGLQMRSEKIDGKQTTWGTTFQHEGEDRNVVLNSRPLAAEGKYDVAAQNLAVPIEALNEIIVEIPCDISGEGPMFSAVDLRWHEVPPSVKNLSKDALQLAVGERDTRIAELTVKLEDAEDRYQSAAVFSDLRKNEVEELKTEVERLKGIISGYEQVLVLKDRAPEEEPKAAKTPRSEVKPVEEKETALEVGAGSAAL